MSWPRSNSPNPLSIRQKLPRDYELRDTIVPGFLCKVTAHGRKAVFMLQYRTNWGERRKPKIGQFGELTVEQARSIAQDWLADVRKGDDPSAAKLAARMALTVKELCGQFIEEYSKPRNKPRRSIPTRAISTATSCPPWASSRCRTLRGRTSPR